MKIGIISDTHNNIRNLEKAIDYFNQKKMALVIHCGDWTSPETLKVLKDLEVPLKGVMGNCDTLPDVYLYKMLKEWNDYHFNVELFEEMLETEVDNKKIAATHGDNEELLRKLINSGRYDLVLSGHLHKALIKKEGKTLTVNPGSLAGYEGREIRREINPTFAVYDTEKGVAEILKIK